MAPRKSRNQSGGSGFRGVKSKAGALVIVLLLAVYSVAAAHLNARYGWSLPQLPSGAVAETSSPDPSSGDVDPASTAGNDEKPSRPGDAETIDAASSDALDGLLREVSTDRFLSPAGLMYGPGSAEGHRLEHLRRHCQDIPDRPGEHGVFAGGMKGTIQTVDEAYEKAKKNLQTSKEVDGRRTIYTVDMGRQVGYVGGREGNRRQNPAATRVRLVLEGNRVITAYPMAGKRNRSNL